ncbi:alpha-crystallin B chain-like, partial [Pollicipes pollicipes]|uniref:alpha-crystallin B chain-like n=1 Tax=Pollicipes pollicipes TaxID=41117 RepID=UPI00188511C0
LGRPVVLHRQNSGTSEIVNHKDRVEMKLDVQHFTPDELKVKISDGKVVVEAKHEEKADEHGCVSRQFTRKYELPEDADEDAVVSHLSKEGVLTITAPRKVPEQPSKPEKSVPLKVDKEEKKAEKK